MADNIPDTRKILVTVIAGQFIMDFIFLYVGQLECPFIKCFIRLGQLQRQTPVSKKFNRTNRFEG